jgi:endonuclease/exonuclease/phosphatase (EEP) superfamily protein YafD
MSLVGVGLALAALWAFGVPLTRWWVVAILLVPFVAGACVLDVRRARRRMQRAATELAMQTCPLGTPVTAVWHADHADVSTATLTDVIAFEEVSRAVWDEAEGVLCLERREGRFWVVPRELVSSESLGLLRESLGSRWAL